MTFSLPRGYLSASQVKTYSACPACYEAEYVLKVPKPIGISLPVGSAVHSGVERMRKNLAAEGGLFEPDYDEYLNAAVETFERQVYGYEEEESGVEVTIDFGSSKYSDIGEAKDHTVTLVDYALKEFRQLDWERSIMAAEVCMCSDHSLLTEQERTYRLGEWLPEDVVADAWPFPVKGWIDALYGYSNGSVSALADLKTSGQRRAPDMDTMLQTMFYARPFHVQGEDVRVGVDVLTKNKVPVLDSYWLGEGGTVTQEEQDYVYRMIVNVAREISRGNFPPRPTFHHSYRHGFPSFHAAVA